MKKIVLIDYENIQDIDGIENTKDLDIKILVGLSQTKISIETVKKLQQYGSAIEWIQVPGQGKNALDFFIAYFLGKYVERNEYSNYLVVSKDSGYDPLIKYLSQFNLKISRITNTKLIYNISSDVSISKDVQMIIEKIENIPIKTRPKKRDKLI